MAEALVAGAVLSAVFNVLLEKLASKEVLDFFKQRKLDEEMLKKLITRMNTVDEFLEDAEEQQITKPAVRNWLDDLKDVAYEADDFLDEILYEAREQQRLEAGPKTCPDLVRDFFSSLNPCQKGMGEREPRLEKILARIDDLLKLKVSLKLQKRDGVRPSSQLSQERVTTSVVDESAVYGRDLDKEAIVELLLTDDECSGVIPVIPIVGMGGIGKTTLSQLVFKDSRVNQRFDKLKAWVCVSEELDVFKLTKNILKEIGSPDCDSMTTNQLQVALEEKVKGERILLVLDDVWNNINWELLLNPLISAAQGSKVLVTTREERRVLSGVSTAPSYHLKELSEDDCWSLFARYALGGRDSDADADLKEIGRKIVRKCKGLPLASKSIGSLLRSERRVGKWEKILESNMWDLNDSKIIPALRLSYHYLPPHLKRCFAYCAMFPKDFQFRMEELISLWMAEGFVVQNNSKSREMEEIGEEYFEDLLSRSFFQKYGYKEDVFVMHDLMNDLAKSIAGEFCFNNVDDPNSVQLTERTRHFFYQGGNASNALEEPGSLSKVQLLRTVFLNSIIKDVDGQVVDLLPRLRRLRVLYLSGYFSDAEEDKIIISDLVAFKKKILSDLVGDAKHLRYMVLENVPIRTLPKTMRALQTLIILECPNIASLSKSIGEMKDLRYLSLCGTGITSLPDSMDNLKDLRHLNLEDAWKLESLPYSIGNLKNLRHLNLRKVYKLKSFPDSIGNLKNLKHLDAGGTSIERLPDSICGLHRLQHLSLKRCQELTSLPNSIGDMKNLRHLDLGGTSLERLPESICGLCNLQHLSLRDCGQLVELPAKMVDLVNLCYLDISYTQLKSMPPGMGKLAKLQTLTNFYVGQDRGSSIAELGHLRNLQGSLVLINLQNVRDVQHALEAKIEDKSGLEQELHYEWEEDDNNSGAHDDSFDKNLLHCLQPNVNIRCITIKGYRGINFPNWVGDSSFSNIVELSLFNCKYCTCLPPLGQLASLQHLCIKEGFDSIVSVGPEFYGDSKSIQPFRSLRSLTLDSFPKWQKWTYSTGNENEDDCCRAFPLLEDLTIRNCPQLEIGFTQGIFTSTLQRLEIIGCNKIFSGPLFQDLHKFSSLSDFNLGSAGDIQSFPGMILLPSTLRTIEIWNLPNLKSLDYPGLQHLISLRTLIINNCPKLECIPDEGLPIFVDCLRIEYCPLLTKRCQREKGEDWPKISHIPDVFIHG